MMGPMLEYYRLMFTLLPKEVAQTKFVELQYYILQYSKELVNLKMWQFNLNIILLIHMRGSSVSEDATSYMLGEPEQRLVILNIKLKKCQWEWK